MRGLIGSDQPHGEPRAGRFSVAAQRGKGRRHPAALLPRDGGLDRAEAQGKLRLRQIRRRAGADQRLDQRILFVDPRVFLLKLGVGPRLIVANSRAAKKAATPGLARLPTVAGQPEQESQLLQAQVGTGEVLVALPSASGLYQGFEHVQRGALDAVAQQNFVAAREALHCRHQPQEEAVKK